MYLRGHLGRGGLGDPQHRRHPQRRDRRPQEDQAPRHPVARRLLCRRLPLAGRRRASRGASPPRQHPLGRGARDQRLWHAGVRPLLPDGGGRALHRRQRGLGHRARAPRVGGVLQLRRRQHPGPPARRGWQPRAARRDLLGCRKRELGVRRQLLARGLWHRVPALCDLRARLRQTALCHCLRSLRE